jgi:hypothetical protein
MGSALAFTLLSGEVYRDASKLKKNSFNKTTYIDNIGKYLTYINKKA